MNLKPSEILESCPLPFGTRHAYNYEEKTYCSIGALFKFCGWDPFEVDGIRLGINEDKYQTMIQPKLLALGLTQDIRSDLAVYNDKYCEDFKDAAEFLRLLGL